MSVCAGGCVSRCVSMCMWVLACMYWYVGVDVGMCVNFYLRLC